jgi:hypothetical protein
MLRLKLVLIVTVALIGFSFAATQVLEGIADSERGQLREEVTRAERSFSVIRRNMELELFGLATELARSDVAAWLGVIQDHEEALIALEREVYQAVPGSVSDEGKAAARARWVEQNKGPLLDKLANEVAERLERFGGIAVWKTRSKLEVVAEAKKMLTLCNAVGYNNCVFRFAHYPLRERVLAIREAPRLRGVGPDVAIVVNENGRGIADADVSQWSDVKDYADKVPAVVEALASGSAVRDIARLPNREGWFVLSVSPIIEGSTRRGAVLIATPIDLERLRKDRDFVGLDIGWLFGAELAMTTLPPEEAHTLSVELKDAGELSRASLVEGAHFIAAVAPLTGNVSMREARLVVAAPRDLHREPISSAIVWTWLFALLFLVLAVAALGWVLHRFFLPLRKIDAGLHEIIQGNKDVEFPTDTHEPTWSTMGQALNAAHAVLTQREDVPDEPADRWAARMLADTEANPKPDLSAPN